VGIQYNLPYGYDMMQNPETVKEIMDNVAKLMERNCNLQTELNILRGELQRLRMMLYGNPYQ
jgi:hypothetical protein